jgi:predicted N-acetyltransferase YhbS
MNIRQATREDSIVLSSLTMDVQSLHAQHYAKIFKMPYSDDFAASFFDGMLADPAVTIFIAEDHGNAVGCIVCKLVERPDNPFTFAARILLVDQISVRPEARGKGIGAALVKQAELLAMESKAERIVLESWDFNLGAHAFFERMGFQKFIFRFLKHL